jgi:predicted  nucleic acid-binding Zn-ribbon protein|nr:MAG TPA: tail tape measure protein [Caudoviricetes sp.]
MAEGTKLADAYVQIIPISEGITGRIKDLFKDLPDEGDKAGDKTGSSFASKLKKAVAAAGVGAAISKVVTSAFTEGAALEQSLGGVETLFKKHADIVKKNAQDAYKTAGVSANEYMENVTSFSASLLSSLGGDTQKAAEVAHTAMVDMSDNANKFGSDMQSIQTAYQGFAKQNYTMLDNLKLGYGGTKSEMERLLQDAQKLSGVEYNIDNLSDVYNAIHTIQQNLDITGTTAKEASTTFSGSFASMKSAAKNFLGVLTAEGDADKAFNDLLGSADTFFENVKRLAKSFLSQSVQVFDTAVGQLFEKMGVDAENIEGVIEGVHNALKSITAAIVTFIAVSKVSAVTKSFEGLTLQMIQGKAMATAMNAEMAITQNLAAGIAAGVALIGSAIINHFANEIDVTESSIVNLSESVKQFSDKCFSTKSAVESLHEELADSTDSNKKQADSYRALNDRLKELNETENKSADEKAEMQSIIDQLNGDIEGLNLTIDDQTGGLKNNAAAVSNMLDAYADMQDTKELQDKLAEALRNQAAAQSEYDEALERYKQAKADGLTGDDFDALALSLNTAHGALLTANEDLSTVRQSIEEANTAQKEFTDAYAVTTGSIAELSEETLSQINDICDKYADAYKTQHDLVFGQIDLLDEFCGKSDVTAEQLIANLDDNINGFTDWENNLAKLKKKVADGIISQDFYNNLEEMGPKGAGYAKAFVDMSDKELKKYSVKSKGIFDEMNDYVDRSMSKMKDSSAKLLADLVDLPSQNYYSMRTAYEVLGQYAADGYADGIQSRMSFVSATVNEMVIRGINAARLAQDSHSPSRVFRTLGGYVGEGYALGVADETYLAVQASENMVRSAIQSASSVDSRIDVSSLREQTATQTVPDTSNMGMRSAILNALAEYASVDGKSTKQPINVTVEIDKRAVGKAVVEDINSLTKLNGKSPLV